jgi:hypothetical protein
MVWDFAVAAETRPAKQPRKQVEYASNSETEATEVKQVWDRRRLPPRNTRQSGRRKPNRKEGKEGQKYKPDMYIRDTQEHKLFNAFMQPRKAFNFTGTEDAQADLVQYYSELAERMDRCFGIFNEA